MIILERKKPVKLFLLEALLRRWQESERDYGYFRELYLQMKKGYEGELKFDREWKELIIPTEYYLFHHFETENTYGHSHQIDTLFICPNFLWLLEIKNSSGRIDFQMERNQLIRTRFDGTTESLRTPIDQAERHIRFLKGKLERLNIHLPLIYSIVIADDATIIGPVPNSISVFHLGGLQSKLDALYRQYPKKLSTQQMEQLKEELVKMQIPIKWRPQIDVRKIKKGALCKQCEYQTVMDYKKGRFICPKCNFKDKETLIEALHDYALLIKPWITNAEFSRFFDIHPKTAYELIKKLPLQQKGEKRGRIYIIPENILEWKRRLR